MKIILFHYFLFTYIIYLNGFLFLKKILRFKGIKNFYETALIGLIITITIAQFLNFFIPLNNHLLFFNIILLIIYTFFFYKIIIESFKINFKIFIILGLISLVNIYGSGFSDDINHYHYSYIANSDVNNFIWGNSFLHPLYGTASSWLIGHSYFNFDQFRLQDIHVLNGIIFFLVLGCLFSELFQNNKKKFYYPIIFSLILFILLKYTRLKEFGIDRPSTLLFCFLIYYYCKYFLDPNKKEINTNFIIILLSSIFIFSIKIIYLPILIFPLIIFLRRNSNLLINDSRYLIVLLPIFVFIFKNLLGTGCFIYPLVSTWFERGKNEIIELFLTIILITIITFILYDLKSKKFYLTNVYFKDLKIILLSIILLSTIVYFFKNPVIRMNHFTIISLMALTISLTFKFDIGNQKRNFINVILAICLIFNFTKNIQRIYLNNFENNPYKMIAEKVEIQKKKNLDDFNYYIGWYGDAPISSNEIKNKKFNRIFIFDILFQKKS